MKINNKFLAYAKLCVVIIIWGANYHIAKYLVDNADVYSVAFVRFFISALVLGFMYYRRHRHIIIYRTKKHWLLLFWAGFFGIFVYMILFFSAEVLIPANHVAILFAFAPCITVLLARYYLKQCIPPFAYVGIVIALLGTIVVVSLSEPSCGGHFVCSGMVKNLSVGQILALGTAIAFAIYNILNRKATQLGIDSLTITTFSTFFGCGLLFIAFLIFGDPWYTLLHKTWLFWMAMLFISVFATALSYKWFSDSIREIGVGQAAVFLNGVPLTAVLTGAIFFGQFISLNIAIAGAVVIFGVVITNCSVNKYTRRL